MKSPVLYYVHDPMCSWCWGFAPVWKQIKAALKDAVEIRYVLGGLAVDSDEVMAVEMQSNIRNTWRRIQREIPATDFNYDFWTKCIPRRSTYPSCRAVIAAVMQDESCSERIITAIQQAYYLQARNPSDNDVLIALAADIGLDTTRFEKDLFSEECNRRLQQQLRLTAALGVVAFPALVLASDMQSHDDHIDIPIDYTDASNVISRILTEI